MNMHLPHTLLLFFFFFFFFGLLRCCGQTENTRQRQTVALFLHSSDEQVEVLVKLDAVEVVYVALDAHEEAAKRNENCSAPRK